MGIDGLGRKDELHKWRLAFGPGISATVHKELGHLMNEWGLLHDNVHRVGAKGLNGVHQMFGELIAICRWIADSNRDAHDLAYLGEVISRSGFQYDQHRKAEIADYLWNPG